MAIAKKTRGEQELEDFELIFKALAHQSRRNILTVLVSREGTMTRHLQQLEKAGLISVDKISREQHYSLNKERLRSVVENWLKWFQ